jgi:hypothetical protein
VDDRWEFRVSKTYQTKQEFMDEVILPLNARMMTPLKPDIRGLYVDGDMVIAFFDASATVRNGTPYKNTYTWYLRISDDKIVEAAAFFDSLEFNDFWSRVSPAE